MPRANRSLGMKKGGVKIFFKKLYKIFGVIEKLLTPLHQQNKQTCYANNHILKH